MKLYSNQDFLPMRPQKLISLWDMLQFSVKELLYALDEIKWEKERIEDRSPDRPPQTKEKTKRTTQILIIHLKNILSYSENLELNETKSRCSHFLNALENSMTEYEFLGQKSSLDSFTPQELVRELKGVIEVANNELHKKKFIYIPEYKHKFLENDDLFGKRVFEVFPLARQEIKAAGNCLAIDLNTAAVFHLMRAAEFGMRSLAIHLKVKLKGKPIEHGGWNEIIEQIEKKVRLRRQRYDASSNKNKKELEFLKFCRMMADELYKFKEYDRNNTMHSIRSYNESEAKGVFDRVQDFMQKLSKEVSEK